MTFAQLPQPNNSRLSLDVAGGEVAAVLKFEGNATKETTLAAVDKLQKALAAGAALVCWAVSFLL